MTVLLRFLLLVSWAAFAQIPSYYNSIDISQNGNDLKTDLSYLITTTQTMALPYTSSDTDTWDAVDQTDEDPNTSTKVLLFYGYDDYDGNPETDRTRDKTSQCHTTSCTGLWTREHVFAKSLANPSLSTEQPGSGTDVHNLRACDGDMNVTRYNRLFEEDGVGGNAHITSNGQWYPGNEWKGDVARIIMYMYVRYPTQCLANNSGVGPNTYSPDMPDVFLQWNVEDPVSPYETQRNTVLETLQGNRNPFIDNPYLATKIWGGANAQDTWGLLGLADAKADPVSVYPTVVHDRLYVTHSTDAKVNIALYNLSGQAIPVKLVNNQIDVIGLSNGVYILKLTNATKTATVKLVKY